MRRRILLSGPLAAASVFGAGLGEPTADINFGPSQEIARVRAPQIFNAVHNAMRQWGSSLHHNGMSFFLATVPKGVLLHHGNGSPVSPSQPEWLAYEIEHAELFARGRWNGPGGGPGRGPGGSPGGGPGGRSQEVLEAADDDDEDNYGYLHVYQTTRPMRYIYIDGMGGGKTSMGTLDSQDLILRGKNPDDGPEQAPWMRDQRDEEPPKPPSAGGPMDERERATDLCGLARGWGLDGVIRMEAGFEIIQCDFSNGLEQVQALQRPDSNASCPGRMRLGGLEQLRGLAERYQGIGSSRTIIDYSSMVSAYFFPVNLTNPDPKRQDLPRLSSAEQGGLAGIKDYVGKMVFERKKQALRTIDWQDVTDMIVGRYADRLKYMTEGVHTLELMVDEVGFLTNVFVDNREGENMDKAIERCTVFYLRSVSPVTEPDVLIKEALKATTNKICEVLFQVRQLVAEDPTPDHKPLNSSVSAAEGLMDYLNWTRFKRCPPCAINEVCLVPMWPFGTVDQYNNPRCSNETIVGDGDNYWGHMPRRPPKGDSLKPGGHNKHSSPQGSEL
ncbi:hypothetical protein GGR51DRAFT_515562 [Nemania sp. FL0031]|nr:hypothetical protein GGR51DRAFT_515562 [Nemania sp. FL0031]